MTVKDGILLKLSVAVKGVLAAEVQLRIPGEPGSFEFPSRLNAADEVIVSDQEGGFKDYFRKLFRNSIQAVINMNDAKTAE